MIKNILLAALFSFVGFSSVYASESDSSNELEFRTLEFSSRECKVFPVRVNGAIEPAKYLLPDFTKRNSPAVRKVLKDLKCEEAFESQLYKGSFGFVRMTASKACKLSIAYYPMQEERYLTGLVRNVSKTPVQGLSLCLPEVSYCFRVPDLRQQDSPFRIYVYPRIQSVKCMYDVVMEAFFDDNAAEWNNLASFAHCLGVMQTTSTSRLAELEDELVCDTHFDLGVENIIMTKEAKGGQQGAFTLIDVADFVRGNSKSAAPLSVDISYFYLRTLDLCFQKRRFLELPKERRTSLIEMFTFRLYQGYFSGHHKVMLEALKPIFTTMKAYDLFKENCIFGPSLFKGESKEAVNNLRLYTDSLPQIIAAFAAVSGPSIHIFPTFADERLLDLTLLDDMPGDIEFPNDVILGEGPIHKRAKTEEDELHPCDFALPLEMFNIKYPLYKGGIFKLD